MLVRDDVLSRRQARRLSREFAGVGVLIPPERLQQISAGAPIFGDEHIDVTFALVATTCNIETRANRFHRLRRRAARWLLVGAMVLVSLTLLIALTLAMLSMVQPTFTG